MEYREPGKKIRLLKNGFLIVTIKTSGTDKNRSSAKEKLSINLHANLNFSEHHSGIFFGSQEVGIPIIKLIIWV